MVGGEPQLGLLEREREERGGGEGEEGIEEILQTTIKSNLINCHHARAGGRQGASGLRHSPLSSQREREVQESAKCY